MSAALDVQRVLRGALARRAWAAHARGDTVRAQTLHEVCCDLSAAIHLLEDLRRRDATL